MNCTINLSGFALTSSVTLLLSQSAAACLLITLAALLLTPPPVAPPVPAAASSASGGAAPPAPAPAATPADVLARLQQLASYHKLRSTGERLVAAGDIHGCVLALVHLHLAWYRSLCDSGLSTEPAVTAIEVVLRTAGCRATFRRGQGHPLVTLHFPDASSSAPAHHRRLAFCRPSPGPRCTHREGACRQARGGTTVVLPVDCGIPPSRSRSRRRCAPTVLPAPPPRRGGPGGFFAHPLCSSSSTFEQGGASGFACI